MTKKTYVLQGGIIICWIFQPKLFDLKRLITGGTQLTFFPLLILEGVVICYCCYEGENKVNSVGFWQNQNSVKGVWKKERLGNRFSLYTIQALLKIPIIEDLALL